MGYHDPYQRPPHSPSPGFAERSYSPYPPQDPYNHGYVKGLCPNIALGF